MLSLDYWTTNLIGVILLGFFMSCLLPVMHESAHRNVCRTPSANRVWGHLAALPLMVSFETYRTYHLAHHEKLGTQWDPEEPMALRGILDYLAYLSPLYFLAQFWCFSISIIRRNPPVWIPENQVQNVRTSILKWLILWILLITILTLVWPRTLGIIYWLPLFASGAWMFLTTLHEHYDDEGERASVISRSVHCNPCLAFMLWNTNHHAAHHLEAELHFSQLPSAERSQMKCMADANANIEVKKGFVAFHKDVLANLLHRRSRTSVNEPERLRS